MPSSHPRHRRRGDFYQGESQDRTRVAKRSSSAADGYWPGPITQSSTMKKATARNRPRLQSVSASSSSRLSFGSCAFNIPAPYPENAPFIRAKGLVLRPDKRTVWGAVRPGEDSSVHPVREGPRRDLDRLSGRGRGPVELVCVAGILSNVEHGSMSVMTPFEPCLPISTAIPGPVRGHRGRVARVLAIRSKVNFHRTRCRY